MLVKVDAEPCGEMDDKDEALEKEKYGPYEKWDIESAVRTLVEAEEIKADAEKMKYVKPFLVEKQKGVTAAINSLSDLKAIAKSKTKG